MCKLFVRHCPLHVHKDTTHPQQRHYKLGVNRHSTYCPPHSRLEKPAVLPATRFLRSVEPFPGADNRWLFVARKIAATPDRYPCLLYTSPSPRDGLLSRMPSSA